jgi:hypothetical protein
MLVIIFVYKTDYFFVTGFDNCILIKFGSFTDAKLLTIIMMLHLLRYKRIVTRHEDNIQQKMV